jgi:hypothetical protein
MLIHTTVRSLMISTFAALSLLTAACGAPPAEAPAAKAAEGAPRLDITGKFQSACVKAGGSPAKLTFDIGASTWKLDYVTYGDDACSTPFATVHIEGPYELGGASPTVAGATLGRFAFSKKTVTAHVAAASGFLAGPQGCGAGSFPENVAVDIGGAGCAGLGQRPLAQCGQDYDVVSLEGDSLTFGARPADNDLCTEDKRPTAKGGLSFARVK